MEDANTTLAALGVHNSATTTQVTDARPYFSVHRVELADSTHYLKRGRNDTGRAALRREVAVTRYVARETPVPVPTVVAADTERTPPALLTVACPGTMASALTPPARTRPNLLESIGERLGALHANTTFDACGPVIVNGDDLSVDARESFTGFRLSRELKRDVLRDGRFADVAREALAFLDREQPNVEPSGGWVLLHGDYNPQNFAAKDNEVTGVIDWEDVLVGDPVYDFTRLNFELFGPDINAYPPEAVAALHKGYERHTELPNDFDRRYRWHWVCNILRVVQTFEEWDWEAVTRPKDDLAADIRKGLRREIKPTRDSR